MDSYKELYEKLKDEFETYQGFAESTIQIITEKNQKLEKALDSLFSIVEVSKYINSNISDENLTSMINDMIIGILGVTHSSIYLLENEELVIKATNMLNGKCDIYRQVHLKTLCEGEPFIINSKLPLFENEDSEIHSLIGVPIYLKESFRGYMIVEHTLCDFFNHEHIKYISSIANQIAIALENNFLYNKIKESSIRDPLLGIYDRKYFFETIKKIIEGNRDGGKGKNFAIVMADIDDFKKLNDTYGHQFGDRVLIDTVNIILENLEDKDIVARYGGEEIILYIDDVTDRDNVIKKIDNIRRLISESIVQYRNFRNSVTVSFGISYYNSKERSIEDVVKKADDMLYQAKHNGKNIVMSC